MNKEQAMKKVYLTAGELVRSSPKRSRRNDLYNDAGMEFAEQFHKNSFLKGAECMWNIMVEANKRKMYGKIKS